MYHLRLIKGLSYYGRVAATRQSPDVFVEDKAKADAAVASGYFELLAQAPPGPEFGHFDVASLESWKLEELKKLAADLGAEVQGLKSKAEYIAAIAAVEIAPGAAGVNLTDYGDVD